MQKFERSAKFLRKDVVMSEQLTIAQEDRLLASLAHSGILFGLLTKGIGGIAIALIIWLTQKGKSAYVAAQSLQALAYQTLIFVLSFILFSCWGIVWVIVMMPSIISSPTNNAIPPDAIWAGLSLLCFPVILMGLATLYGLWGAIRCLGGHDFNYILIGNWLRDR